MDSAEGPSFDQLCNVCLNMNGLAPPDLARVACTRLLDTYQLSEQQRAIAFVGLARAAHVERNYAAALADADRAVSLYPLMWQGHSTRGRILVDLGRFAEAIAAFDQVLRLSPADAMSWCARGTAKRMNRDYDGAWADLNEATRLNPKAAEPWSQRSLVCTARGDREGAVAQGWAAMDLAPDSPVMGGRLCWALALAGVDLERALLLAEWAIRTWPNDLGYDDAKGVILLKMRRLDEAYAVYDGLMARAPDDATRYRYQYARGVAGWWNGKTRQGYNDIFMSGRKGGSMGQNIYRGYGIDHDHPPHGTT